VAGAVNRKAVNDLPPTTDVGRGLLPRLTLLPWSRSMTFRRKRLLVVPALLALYLVNPLLAVAGVACGILGVFFVRRAREGMTSTAQ
jgi:hypothetical protein